jgi:hypothetical protein
LAGRYAILFLTAVPFVFAATLAHADDLKLEDVVSAAMTQSTAVKRADAKTRQA